MLHCLKHVCKTFLYASSYVSVALKPVTEYSGQEHVFTMVVVMFTKALQEILADGTGMIHVKFTDDISTVLIMPEMCSILS